MDTFIHLMSRPKGSRKQRPIHCRHCDGVNFVVVDWMIDRMAMVSVRCATPMCGRFYLVGLSPAEGAPRIWGNAGRDHAPIARGVQVAVH